MKPVPIPCENMRIPFDHDWRFALGHGADVARDFSHGTRYFSHYAKAGFADGPASPDFDDRHWRRLDLPHDWAVELPFSERASHSHGYKTIGMQYPESSVGWYRKQFTVDAAALGSRFWIAFDGIYRDARVWVNGFYCGNEEGGYLGCRYDISEYLRYGETNTLAVRVDARMEEGWYYEGAGIYRHVWLEVLDPVHIVQDSLSIVCEVEGTAARVAISCELVNQGRLAATALLDMTIERPLEGRLSAPAGEGAGPDSTPGGDGASRERVSLEAISLESGESRRVQAVLTLVEPALWDIEKPLLHRLRLDLRAEGGLGGIPLGDNNELVLSEGRAGQRQAQVLVQSFGIRTVLFTADRGFFLNGRRVTLKGSNNHQDHAGLGVALPDAVQDYRIRRLKAMGSNAYRCSHHPPSPALLDACDRLGMLVIDENRLMGVNHFHRDQVERMIRRDRNHPSVILWSLGNEEWAIEGNMVGSRIALAMQDHARALDPSRRFTVAISGGWGHGISTVLDVMGYNYIAHGSTDEQHRLFPDQPGVGTEETTTQGTRGCWLEDANRCSRAPVDNGTSGFNAEVGWKHYASRPWLSGLFYWTGFDYRGEPVPFEWPAVVSQFGIMDTCGFEKACFWYLKSWWRSEPFCKIAGHLNWAPGAPAERTTGDDIPAMDGNERARSAAALGELEFRVYANAEEVELVHNGKSLGTKLMETNGHLSWRLVPLPGRLEAIARTGGKIVARDVVETAGPEESISLTLDPDALDGDALPVRGADGRRIAVITVEARDAVGRPNPVSALAVRFRAEGGVRLLGAGNGDPMSHEADQSHDCRATVFPGPWRAKRLEEAALPSEASLCASSGSLLPGGAEVPREASLSCFDGDWEPAFIDYVWTLDLSTLPPPGAGAWYRAPCTLALSGAEGRRADRARVRFTPIAERMTLWVNGLRVGTLTREDLSAEGRERVLEVPMERLFEGENRLALWAEGLGDRRERRPADFSPVSLTLEWDAAPLERRLFNGKAQVLAQMDGPGCIIAEPSRCAAVAPARLPLG